jgi:hypothetical protein
MTTIQEFSEALRHLPPEEIRNRLLEMEREEKALRILLRLATARQPKPTTGEGRADA